MWMVEHHGFGGRRDAERALSTPLVRASTANILSSPLRRVGLSVVGPRARVNRHVSAPAPPALGVLWGDPGAGLGSRSGLSAR